MKDSASYVHAGQMFRNRLIKRYKHLRKYAKRFMTSAYRVYDKDIPEAPVSVDIFTDHPTGQLYAVLTWYESSQQDTETSALHDILPHHVIEVFSLNPSALFVKHRKRQKGDAQYEKISSQEKKIIVQEGRCFFLLNLSDYLDTGLFLDHRPTRLLIGETAAGKTVLNLFCYTGAFSIHALCGSAKSVHSVDLSKRCLRWAEENARINGVHDHARAFFIQSDTRLFLAEALKKKKTWDIIVCDPPTFSNSKRTEQFFDINRHWAALVQSCCSVLSKNGVLYFSTNSKTLTFNLHELGTCTSGKQKCFTYNGQFFSVEDNTVQSIPEDFRNKKIHRLWKITRCS